MMSCQIAIPVTDSSQVGEVRRRATRIAEDAGLNVTDRGKAAIIATELATNLVRHAESGQVLLRTTNGGGRGVEILSIDRGPGMVSVARCLEDGYSTGGTAGNGLGAVQRLSTRFDIGSSQPGGTVVYSQLNETQAEGAASPYTWAAVCRPATGEEVCGDGWHIAESSGMLAAMILDGLGHGPEAAKAAKIATEAFAADPFAPLPETVQRIDRLMRGSRGGALAIAHLDLAAGVLRYIGVGNIAARLKRCIDEPARGMCSHNGTMGVQLRKVQQFEYPLAPNSLLVMHSDGLQTRWTLDQYAGWPGRHPAVLAGMLYRDYTRGRDDVTVAAVRIHSLTQV